jgi:hypothetical protein
MKRRMFLVLIVCALLSTGCDNGKKISDPVIENPTRRALLVGINAYPNAPLAGCVNDGMDMRDELKAFHGFRDDEILIITDGAATTEQIWAGLKWLTVGAKRGDIRFFDYSGHGVEYVTANGKLHQCICPVDFDWSEPRMIMDHQFKTHFEKMPDGVTFNWLSDSCHSGDLTRGLKKGTPKVYPIVAREMLIKIHNAKVKSKGLVGGILDVGFLSGCQSNQTSADAFDASQNRPRGALHWHFLDALKEHRGKPLEEVAEIIRMTLARDQYDQRPSVEGPQRKQPFLKWKPQ